ncbi:MAG: biopolymer transporter ExbD [Myxococcota bacterium]
MRFSGADGGTGRRRDDSSVDVTPLIDIIFQLVLFFMVSTTFISSPGIEVDLPRSSAQTILQDDNDLEVWITRDGAVKVDDVAVDQAGLRARFEAARKKNPRTLVIVKADKDVDHGRVVAVMDMARSLGLGRLAIATEANVAAPGGGGDDAP